MKDHVPTKIVTLKVRLGDGEHVNPGVHLLLWVRTRNGNLINTVRSSLLVDFWSVFF